MYIGWLTHEFDENVPITPLTLMLLAMALAVVFNLHPLAWILGQTKKMALSSARIGVNSAVGLVLSQYQEELHGKTLGVDANNIVDQEIKLQLSYIDKLHLDFTENSKAFPYLVKLESLTTLSVDTQNKVGKMGVRGLSALGLFLNYVPISKEVVDLVFKQPGLIPILFAIRIQLLKRLLAMLGDRLVGQDRKEAKANKTAKGLIHELIAPGTDLLLLLETTIKNPTNSNSAIQDFAALIPKDLFTPLDGKLGKGGTLDEDAEHQILAVVSQAIFRTLQQNSRHPDDAQIDYKVGNTTVRTELEFVKAMMDRGWNARAWIYTRSADFLNLATVESDVWHPMAVPVQFRIGVDPLPLPVDEELNPDGKQLPPQCTATPKTLAEADSERPFLVFVTPHAEWIYEMYKDGTGREDVSIQPVSDHTSQAIADPVLLAKRKSKRGKRFGVRWFHDIGEGINWFPYQLWSSYWSEWTGGRCVRTVENPEDVLKVLDVCMRYRNGVDKLDLGRRNGYGKVGVCLDSVAQVEEMAFGRETIFPVFGNVETRQLALEKNLSFSRYGVMLDDAQIADDAAKAILDGKVRQSDWLQRAGSCWPFQRGKEPIEILKLTRLYLEQAGVLSKQDPQGMFIERP
jgi:hypothetical protein